MITWGPSPTSYVKMRRCTPIWGAARPRPIASYIVSYMVSASPTRLPLRSSTSRERCLSTGSPKRRTGWVANLLLCRRRKLRLCGAARQSRRRRVKSTGTLRESDPERVDVDAEATVLAGGGEIGDGERVAQRVRRRRLHERAGRRRDCRRTEYPQPGRRAQLRARDVDRLGGATQLREAAEGREPEDASSGEFGVGDDRRVGGERGLDHVVVGDAGLHKQATLAPSASHDARRPHEQPQRLFGGPVARREKLLIELQERSQLDAGGGGVDAVGHRFRPHQHLGRRQRGGRRVDLPPPPPRP